ncbi:MAG: glycosyltransferase [Gammaproteobacteria bacterium]|nr:glycosyltransferase [Gammaproteobacteria bacterium]
MTKLSIITVCYNAAAHIETVFHSIGTQGFVDVEHIVIDGASSDGTLDIIDRYRDSIAYFVSEPDDGVYNAMNKGIKAATGDVLFFLNADDRLCDRRVLSDVVDIFDCYPGLELVYGDVLREVPSGLRRWTQPELPTRRELAATTICHQGMFVRRDLFERHGGFDESFSIVSDYEWLLRVMKVGVCSTYLRRDIAIIGTRGLSHTLSYKKERRRAMSRYFNVLEIFFWRTLSREIMPHILNFPGNALRFLISPTDRQAYFTKIRKKRS